MEREQRLLAIVQVQTDIAASELDQAEVAAVIAGRARDLTGADGAFVDLLSAGRLELAHAVGTGAASAELARLSLGSAQLLRCDDAERDARVDRDGCVRAGAISILCAPLIQSGRARGVLQVCSSWPRRFDAGDEEVVALLANVLSANLDRGTRAPDRSSRIRDPLTGLGNQRAFDERLALECGRREREGGPLTLVLAGTDRFTDLVERYGATVAEGALRTVAAVFQRWTRSIDGIFRIGADEFALILPGTTSQAARVLVDRIIAQLRDAHPLDVSVSFGIAEATGHDPAGLQAAAVVELRKARAPRLGDAIV